MIAGSGGNGPSAVYVGGPSERMATVVVLYDIKHDGLTRDAIKQRRRRHVPRESNSLNRIGAIETWSRGKRRSAEASSERGIRRDVTFSLRGQRKTFVCAECYHAVRLQARRSPYSWRRRGTSVPSPDDPARSIQEVKATGIGMHVIARGAIVETQRAFDELHIGLVEDLVMVGSKGLQGIGVDVVLRRLV